jgi:hypothetical protein
VPGAGATFRDTAAVDAARTLDGVAEGRDDAAGVVDPGWTAGVEEVAGGASS